MPIRHCIIAIPALALSACAWLPWHRPVPPVPPASVPPATVPAPSPKTAVLAPLPPAPAQLAQPSPAARATVASPEPRPLSVPGAEAANAPSTPADGLELRGHIVLKAGPGQQLHAGEATDTVVFFVPAAGAPAPRARQADIITSHRDFQPTAIAVPLGSTVSFVNRDDVRHNVFSVTPGAAFNLGYQAAGKRADHVFDEPGLVLISCNVHHSMEMDVFVVPSPYVAHVAADGSFVLRGLPAGPGELVAWNPRARRASEAVSLPSGAPVSLPLLAERPRVVTRIDVGQAP